MEKEQRLEELREQVTWQVKLPDLSKLPDLNAPEIREDTPIPQHKLSQDRVWRDIEKIAKRTRYRLIFNNCGGLPAPDISYGRVMNWFYRKNRQC